MPSFSTTLEHSIHAALALANERSHEFATLEHLLLSLLDEPDAIRVLRACDVDLEELHGNLVEFIEGDLASLVTDVEGSEAVPTAAFQRVIQDIPEVLESYRMSGEVDYLLKAVVSDMAGYDRLYKKLIAVDLFDVSSSFVMETLKHSTALPLR